LRKEDCLLEEEKDKAKENSRISSLNEGG